jgi:multiple sugar transport system substrate-binding protein
MRWLLAGVLATVLVIAPLRAKAADLVVWWDKGIYPEQDAALAELISTFEQDTGKDVELVQHPLWEMEDKARAAIETGHPPDFIFGVLVDMSVIPWACEDRLVDLAETLGHLRDIFDADMLETSTLLNCRTGARGLYALPIGRVSNHLHVWRSLLEQAGFTLADIPKQWKPFWSFWCDQVQPAVRRVTGRDDIWGVGLAMGAAGPDPRNEFSQFQHAYETFWADRDGQLTIDDPAVRARLIEALDAYTAIYRKGCTPPDAVDWVSGLENNEAFLAQRVMMTANVTLVIANALKTSRPDDYYRNVASIDWPTDDAYGQPLAIEGGIVRAAVFNNERNVGVAKDFVRFLVEDGWLAHYLDFSLEAYVPPMTKLLDQPFWLDPSDPHRMAAAIQTLTRPFGNIFDQATVANWELRQIDEPGNVWQAAVHRVAADGISPEQAVDDAIARIKQILAE